MRPLEVNVQAATGGAHAHRYRQSAVLRLERREARSTDRAVDVEHDEVRAADPNVVVRAEREPLRRRYRIA